MTTVAVIGCGKLGAPMAALFADAGHDVRCWDISWDVRQALRHNVLPSLEEGQKRGLVPNEPGFLELWRRNRARLTIPDSTAAETMRGAAFTFVVTPTPSGDDDLFKPDAVTEAARQFGESLRTDDGVKHKVLVVVSTTTPGDVEEVVKPAAEQAGGRRCGDGWGLCYSPEFIALGDVLRGMSRPDFCLIGESDIRAGDALEAFYLNFYRLAAKPVPICRMSIRNAELAKLLLNCYLTLKISYANAVSLLCEQVPGGDATAILDAIGNDRRVGKRFLKPGGPLGGPCLPRDQRCLLAYARRAFGQRYDMPEEFVPDAWTAMGPIAHAIRETDRFWYAGLARAILSGKPRSVAILGAAYRSDTPVVAESPGILLARAIRRATGDMVSVTIHDPVCELAGWPISHDLEGACRNADAIVIVTPHTEYKTIAEHPEWFRRDGDSPIPALFDCWGVADSPALRGACRYHRFGEG